MYRLYRLYIDCILYWWGVKGKVPPVTPNHLTYGRVLNQVSNETEIVKDVDVNNGIVECFDCIEQVLKHFWNRWKTEYLIELRELQSKSK